MKDADEPRQLQPLVTEPGKAEDAIEPNVTEPTPEVCRNCRFWQDTEDFEGKCRRNAPVHWGTMSDSDEMPLDWGVWPWTEWKDWCGEFQVRPKDTKQV